MGVPVQKLAQRTKDLHEFNPMLGHRGCRLAITFPEIYAMQARAILEAAVQRRGRGHRRAPRDHDPARDHARASSSSCAAIVDDVAEEVFAEGGHARRRSLRHDDRAPARGPPGRRARPSRPSSSRFGTNDLTQATMGLSRDDAGKFLPAYVEAGILPKDPVRLD